MSDSAFAFAAILFLSAVSTAAVSAGGSSAAQWPRGMMPESVDLRPLLEKWGLPGRRQGHRGTCSVFTIVGALEYAVAKKQERGVPLSVEFLNWAAHRAVNRSADGGFFSELWKGFERYGICAEQELPYRERYHASLRPANQVLEAARKLRTIGPRLHWIKQWDVKTGLTEAEFNEVKRVLAMQWPVCGGFRWPKQAEWKDGVLQMCPPEAVYDGHSVLLVGYRDDERQPGGGEFLIRNSGGDARDGAIPYAYARAYMNDAAWIE